MDVTDFPENCLVRKRGAPARVGVCKGVSPIFYNRVRVVWAAEAARGSLDWDLVLPEDLEMVDERA